MLAFTYSECWSERLEVIVSRTKQVSKRKRRCKIRAGFGGCWVIVVASGRSVRSNRCASCGCADAKFPSESRNHAPRGGNRRRQPGDILCFRQGKRRTITARRTADMWLLDGHLLHI